MAEKIDPKLCNVSENLGVLLDKALCEEDFRWKLVTEPDKILSEFVKQKFQIPNVRVYGDLGDIVECVAVMPGSGGDYIKDAINAGADVIITGDMNHHGGIDAIAQGITVIDAGHYGIEKLFVSYMEEFIKRELPELTVYKAQIKEPFVVM